MEEKRQKGGGLTSTDSPLLALIKQTFSLFPSRSLALSLFLSLASLTFDTQSNVRELAKQRRRRKSMSTVRFGARGFTFMNGPTADRQTTPRKFHAISLQLAKSRMKKKQKKARQLSTANLRYMPPPIPTHALTQLPANRTTRVRECVTCCVDKERES